MRSPGNPWQLLIALVALGFVLDFVGEGVFMALVWVAVGIYAIGVVAPMLAPVARGLEWLGVRIDEASSQPRARPFAQDPYWQAYEAMGLQDMAKLRRLVETQGVDPFAPYPAHIQPKPTLADSLYGYAKGTNYKAALDYFDSLDRSTARNP